MLFYDDVMTSDATPLRFTKFQTGDASAIWSLFTMYVMLTRHVMQ